jgi:subtilisin family serine protease
MKFLKIFIVLQVAALSLSAQQYLSPDLRAQLKQSSPEETIDVFLRGDLSLIVPQLRSMNAIPRKQIKGIAQYSLTRSQILQLNEVEGIETVEFHSGTPEITGDMMLLNNNVHPVHNGVQPLPQAYTGSGVIVGFVDTGIELNHPDFQNEDGTTRVLAIWDQTQPEDIPFRVPQPYNYGQEWNAEDINAGITNHDDQAQWFGHGSTVSGSGVGNANATGEFRGVAPDADIVVVSSDFTRPNWTSSVADAIDFVFSKADALNKPAVVNLSLGTALGSHDGLDAAALLIDDMLEGTTGRVVVCAAGNSGNIGPYHLSYDVPQTDTAFTWLNVAPGSPPAVKFEVWADSVDFAETQFTIGADLTTPNYEFRGYAGWRNLELNLNQDIIDTIFYDGAILGIVHTWCGQRGDQILLQVIVTEPFSNQYLWRFATTGGGHFDAWSTSVFGRSDMIHTGLPSEGAYPDMSMYRLPDTDKTIYDSWICSDNVITVGNYKNRESFTNYLGEETTFDVTRGAISENSSRGPTRDERQKPDIAASGDHTLSAGRLATLQSFINTSPDRVSQGGWHYVNGGTSMASPVVAGAAALYLERDPEADFMDIKNAIIENALADEFTGILPGQQFGFGKLDVFAMLTVPFETVGLSGRTYSEMDIFPNPSDGTFNMKVGDENVNGISIFDLSGKLVYQSIERIQANSVYTIHNSNLLPGIYLISGETEAGNSLRAKLVVGK